MDENGSALDCTFESSDFSDVVMANYGVLDLSVWNIPGSAGSVGAGKEDLDMDIAALCGLQLPSSSTVGVQPMSSLNFPCSASPTPYCAFQLCNSVPYNCFGGMDARAILYFKD